MIQSCLQQIWVCEKAYMSSRVELEEPNTGQVAYLGNETEKHEWQEQNVKIWWRRWTEFKQEVSSSVQSLFHIHLTDSNCRYFWEATLAETMIWSGEHVPQNHQIKSIYNLLTTTERRHSLKHSNNLLLKTVADRVDISKYWFLR